jgi:ribonuclease BN (tRNA processing enzyme)
VLLDGGAPLLPHLGRVGVDPLDIEVVFLTHFHGDHTLGLPPFVLHRIFVDKPRLITFVGPEGIQERLEKLFEVSWGIDWKPVMLPRFKARYLTAKPRGQAAGYEYQTVKLDHGTAGCNGYRLHIGGKILAYSGDTEPTPPLDRLGRGDRRGDRTRRRVQPYELGGRRGAQEAASENEVRLQPPVLRDGGGSRQRPPGGRDLTCPRNRRRGRDFVGTPV